MRSKEKGFTLAEVIGVIALLSVAILIYSQTFLFGQNSSIALMKSAAKQIAIYNASESLLASTGADGALTAGSHQMQYNTNGQIDPEGSIQVDWIVRKDTPSPGIYEIEINARDSTTNLVKRPVKFYRREPNAYSMTGTAGFVTLTTPPPTATPTATPSSPTPTPSPTATPDPADYS